MYAFFYTSTVLTGDTVRREDLFDSEVVSGLGGLPFEFPVMSTGETSMRPTAMLFRNLASMDVEESVRANPLDGVVLLAGCDKTTPATIMGAASVDLPTILVSGGPMLSGKYRGTDIGSGTNVWSMSEDLRAGNISLEEFHEAESCMHRSHGHCMTMGTASTMASANDCVAAAAPGDAKAALTPSIAASIRSSTPPENTMRRLARMRRRCRFRVVAFDSGRL